MSESRIRHSSTIPWLGGVQGSGIAEPMLEGCDFALEPLGTNDHEHDVPLGRRLSRVTETGVRNPSWETAISCPVPSCSVFIRSEGAYSKSWCLCEVDGEDILCEQLISFLFV